MKYEPIICIGAVEEGMNLSLIGEHTGDGDEGVSRKTTWSVAPESSESQSESGG